MTESASVRELFHERIDVIDFDQARNDVYPFVARSEVLDLWSREFFHAAVDDLTVI